MGHRVRYNEPVYNLVVRWHGLLPICDRMRSDEAACWASITHKLLVIGNSKRGGAAWWKIIKTAHILNEMRWDENIWQINATHILLNYMTHVKKLCIRKNVNSNSLPVVKSYHQNTLLGMRNFAYFLLVTGWDLVRLVHRKLWSVTFYWVWDEAC